jgi:hypothetical protein
MFTLFGQWRVMTGIIPTPSGQEERMAMTKGVNSAWWALRIGLGLDTLARLSEARQEAAAPAVSPGRISGLGDLRRTA